MNDLFDRAKNIGLSHIMEWLPAGKLEGDEYSAINPTRNDHKPGSFKINVKTGKWADFADDVSGNDVVSLYAYLNNDELSIRASKYKNLQGGIQTEAAKEILEKYDPTYFPTDNDFKPVVSNNPANRWDNYRYVNYKINDIPNLDPKKYEGEKWGSFIESWDFYFKGRLVFKICRFKSGNKKSDIPFTLWACGSEIKWRAKAPEELYPLWNIDTVASDTENKPIILTEGQKDASRGNDPKYLYVGFYGGANNSKQTNWSTLTGRHVYFWADADAAGRKTIKEIRKYAEQFDFNLDIIYAPDGVKKGWGLADAVAEGRSLEEIINPPTKIEGPQVDGSFLDDVKDAPFRIVGTSNSDIIFYAFNSNRIEKCKGSSLTKNFLMTIAPREWWGMYFNKTDGGIQWEAAIDWIIRKSDNCRVFNFNRVRGTGAWKGEKDIIVNTGEYLLVNGNKEDLHSRVGEYVYEKKEFIPYTYDNPLYTEDSAKLLDAINSLSWVDKVASHAFAGWLLLAPWGGLLRWRPHIWIVGPSGSGKSTVIEKIVEPIIVEKFGERGDGTSTVAGVRQRMANSSKPYVGDEMESDNAKYAESIEQILKMFRSSSSGIGGGATLMGTADGAGQQFVMQSMACFASIGAAIKHNADANRFTICELATPRKKMIEERKQNWYQIERKLAIFNSDYAVSFHARTYTIINEVLKCVDIFRSATTDITHSMRDGDQLGTLLAGSYMINHDKAATMEEAKGYLERLNVSAAVDLTMKSDEELCLDEILGIKLEVANRNGRMNLTLGQVIAEYINYKEKIPGVVNYDDDELPVLTRSSMSMAMAQNGFKLVALDDGFWWLYIAKGHSSIIKGLKGTAWDKTYVNMLKRLENVKEGSNTNFAGQKKRFLKVNLKGLYDNDIF
jgi:putative DNA primase/helicase